MATQFSVEVHDGGGGYRWTTVTLKQGVIVVKESECVDKHEKPYLGLSHPARINHAVVDATLVAKERARGILDALVQMYREG